MIERSIREHIFLCLLLFFFSSLSALPVLAEPEGPQAVIFMYHRFGDSSHPSTNVTRSQFEEQLDFLEKNDFTVLPLEEVVKALQQANPLPDKTVALTIDDAYFSVYEVAYPKLKAKGYPFTVFVSTGGIDNKIPAYMTWQQMREMQKKGATFANHSHTHDHLVRKKFGESQEAWSKRIQTEITTAQHRLSQELGQAPALFAYPYGEYNLEMMHLVDKLGYTGFGQHSGGVGPLSDRRALPRFPVAEAYADIQSFRTKAFSLAMPVVEQEPVEQVTTEKRPQLTVSLAPSSADLEQLACYFGDRRMKIQWLQPEERFTIQTEKDLPAGRSRYNCSAPDSKSDRYFWLSHPWLRSPTPKQ